jgi:hypothetical protein
MNPGPDPSAIVARLLEAAKEFVECAVEHRQASLAEHERGVLGIFRRSMGPVLGRGTGTSAGAGSPVRPAAARDLSRVWYPAPATPVAGAAASQCVR